MLNEKKFRECAKVELREIGSQVASLARDRDLYWNLEREIIGHNPRLQKARSPFYRVLFEDVVGQCRSAGLVGGEDFAVDGSLIGGDAARDRRVESVDARSGTAGRQLGPCGNIWRP